MALTSKFPVSLVHERITRMRQRPPTEERFRAVDEKVAEMPKLGDVSLAIERADGSFRHVFTTGPLDPNSRFASGSVTKLFTPPSSSASSTRQLSYDTLIASACRPVRSTGCTSSATRTTVRADHPPPHRPHLGSGQLGGTKDPCRDVIDQIVDWDRVVSVDEQMETAARNGAKFPPGQGNRAHYSDLNAELLSQVAQHTTGMTYQELANHYIITPLELEHTTFVRPGRHDYAEVRTDKHVVWSSRYLSSSLGSSGVISTALDLLVFIRAFHTGRIFDHGHIQDPELRRISTVRRYGHGMMAMGLPKILSPLVPAPLILGHTGVHGAFAFYCPSRSAFIAGSVNSIVTPPFEVIYRYLEAL